MWINFKFLHMTDVEKSEISFNMCTIYGILLHFKLFCCKICVFLRFTLFCRKIGLLRFTRFCVEKILTKNSVRGEKMTNIRYGPKLYAGEKVYTYENPKNICDRFVLKIGQFGIKLTLIWFYLRSVYKVKSLSYGCQSSPI